MSNKGSKIKDLELQTDSIYNEDFLMLDRDTIPFRVEGKDYKTYCIEKMGESVKYCKEGNLPCITKKDVFELGKSLLIATGRNVNTPTVKDGLPIKLYGEKGWMWLSSVPSYPEQIIISFSNSSVIFEDGDFTSLIEDTFLESFFGILEGTEDIPIFQENI